MHFKTQSKYWKEELMLRGEERKHKIPRVGYLHVYRMHVLSQMIVCSGSIRSKPKPKIIIKYAYLK
jgi:hypothetical protein